MVDWSIVIFVIYAIIGFCVFCYFVNMGWNTGDAVDFVMFSFCGGLIGVFWLPAAIIYGLATLFFGAIQALMDMFKPKRTASDKMWDKYFDALTAFDEEIYPEKKIQKKWGVLK